MSNTGHELKKASLQRAWEEETLGAQTKKQRENQMWVTEWFVQSRPPGVKSAGSFETSFFPNQCCDKESGKSGCRLKSHVCLCRFQHYFLTALEKNLDSERSVTCPTLLFTLRALILLLKFGNTSMYFCYIGTSRFFNQTLIPKLWFHSAKSPIVTWEIAHQVFLCAICLFVL